MRLIGLRCKHGDMFSLQVLIGRGLELQSSKILTLFAGLILYSVFNGRCGGQIWGLSLSYAPLAQLVEQLTLNQWVPGSNP